ncbi:MAG: chorismate synthase [Candidatus Omnitrophota bacterium]|nr:MAG: chorismate synthase [Candidatus Omnitrophota bacterium]
MMRILTAGESHGPYMVAILEGFPKGVKIEEKFIDQELKRRMSGLGRGKRMQIEKDKVEILAGLRNKYTLGSPIAVAVKNKDTKIFPQKKDNLAPLVIPRPAHADLAGALKYQETDIRNILERASARETVCRVALGAICKQFLLLFGIKIASFTVRVGKVCSTKKPHNISEVIRKGRTSKLNCIDREKERLMAQEIKRAEKDMDSLGGVAEVWIEGVPVGLGSFMSFEKRLDARLSSCLMSIPAVKGVEIGLGFEYAHRRGSKSHDAIEYCKRKGFLHPTNNAGGIEAGISTGSPIVLRVAMKPIATLRKPLDSVNLLTKKSQKASVVRSDTCAIVACGVIAESMSAFVLTEVFLEKFGCDTSREIKANYQAYLKHLKNTLL